MTTPPPPPPLASYPMRAGLRKANVQIYSHATQYLRIYIELGTSSNIVRILATRCIPKQGPYYDHGTHNFSKL